ncbi:MAG: MFS transporter [Pseudomonadota bacterium]
MDASVHRREFTTPAIGVVTLCFLLNTLARGSGETLAVFYGPLLSEFGWGRAWTSSLYSAFMISIAVAGPFIGAGYDRYGGRIIYVGGLLFYGAGFLVAAQMSEVWHGWLGLGLMVGIGAAATGMTPATAIISRWFDRNMAFAISFAYSGLAAGTMLMAPLAGWLIEAGGWRLAYERMGTGLICLAALIVLLPWRRIGQGIKPAAPRRAFLPDRAVLSDVPFWGLFATFFIASGATYAVQVQLVVYLEEVGYDRFDAIWIYGLSPLISVIGIIGSGWLADRFGQRTVASVAYLMTITGVLALAALSDGPSLLFLVLFLLGFGGAMGSRGPVVSSLCARLFDGQVGAVFGMIMIGLGLGGAFGAWFAGWLHEVSGGYFAGYLFVGVISCVGLSLFWLIPELVRGERRTGLGRAI